MKLQRRILFVLGIAGAGSALLASERLLHPTTKNPLFWSNPANISIVINGTGSDDIADGSHVQALRTAIDEWNRATGTTVQLVEDASPASMARTDYAATNIHLVMFDEDNTSGFFGGNGVVAVTPVWFFSNGLISDADVIYNGDDFMFTTSGQPGRFDVQDVGTHELGHLIGFDHSGWAGATMYPYVDPTVILHRSLAQDEISGLRAAHPSAAFGSITGVVRRASDSSVVVGAHVVCRDDDGRTVAATLSTPTGAFTIGGLDAGTYTVLATPLEGAVEASNLGSGYTNGVNGFVIETDFSTTEFAGGPVVVPPGGTTALAGDLLVAADAAFVLGSTADNYPLRVRQGQSVVLLVRGSGLATGASLVPSDPSITINNVIWAVGSVQFQCTVPGGAAVGHFDLLATNLGGERSLLVAPIEITPPDPTVALVSPNQGPYSGGTALTLTGTGFRPGARVVIGDAIYIDGALGGCTVVDPTTITLTTAPTMGGNHDVIVVDETGVEGRLADGFQSLSTPTLSTVFPAAGALGGGTRVVLRGTDFTFDAQVRIDGQVQTVQPNDISATRIEFVTDAGLSAGSKTIEVVNPGNLVASLQYAFVNEADPEVTMADPATGTAAGGETITIHGFDFDANTNVLFGANVDTGAGGTAAASVTLLDANTLEVVTPVHAAGPQSVLVLDTATGQADVLAAGFTFAGGGGGGGGCYVRSLDGGRPFDPRRMLEGGAWILLCAILVLHRARRARPATA